MLSSEWNLGKKEAKADNDICALIYLMVILEESEEIVKYKEGKKLIGFCGYSKENSKKHKLSKSFYGFIKNRLYKSKHIKDLKALKEYEDNYYYVPAHLKNYFDGEISILIVNNNYRGKKIGEKLLLDVFEKARRNNIKNLQILTDESCNYKFYECLGCKKIYETVIKNKETLNKETEMAFIYEKRL